MLFGCWSSFFHLTVCLSSLSRLIGVNKPHYNCILFINWTIHAQCKKYSSDAGGWQWRWSYSNSINGIHLFQIAWDLYVSDLCAHIDFEIHIPQEKNIRGTCIWTTYVYILWAWMPLAEEHWAPNVGDMLEANELDRNFWWFDLYVGERLKDTNWRTNAVTEHAVLFWHMRDCYRCNHPRRSKASHYFCCFVVVDEI